MSMEELQIGAGQPEDVFGQTKKFVIAPEEIAIPEAATAEIKRLHMVLVNAAKSFEVARAAFGEYVRVTRTTLNIPIDARWEIKEDATAFIKLPEGQ
jgi:hypothetical protein